MNIILCFKQMLNVHIKQISVKLDLKVKFLSRFSSKLFAGINNIFYTLS